MSDTIRGTLRRALAEDPSVHLLGEAVELSRATRGLMALFADRVHLLPAADGALIGTAVGMALTGARPVVELAGGPALWGSLQQLGQEAASLSGGEFQAPVVVRVPLAPGESAPLDLLTAIPGLTLAAAASAAGAAELLSAAMQARGPVVILEPAEAMADRSAATAAELGQAVQLATGSHISLLAFGAGVGAALTAAEQLSQDGISADIIDLRYLSPLDVDTIAASVRKTGRAVVVGASERVLTQAILAAFLRLESPPATVGADPDVIVQVAHQSINY
jgi:pyruvate/2-oxoglutarate/acetoin dehydrogenase E1 component